MRTAAIVVCAVGTASAFYFLGATVFLAVGNAFHAIPDFSVKSPAAKQDVNEKILDQLRTQNELLNRQLSVAKQQASAAEVAKQQEMEKDNLLREYARTESVRNYEYAKAIYDARDRLQKDQAMIHGRPIVSLPYEPQLDEFYEEIIRRLREECEHRSLIETKNYLILGARP